MVVPVLYRQLFPANEQIFIATFGDDLRIVFPETLPTELLYTCREIYTEASEYLYNSYLFNLIGTKKDCLSNYGTFVETLKKHAREAVQIDAFGNLTMKKARSTFARTRRALEIPRSTTKPLATWSILRKCAMAVLTRLMREIAKPAREEKCGAVSAGLPRCWQSRRGLVNQMWDEEWV